MRIPGRLSVSCWVAGFRGTAAVSACEPLRVVTHAERVQKELPRKLEGTRPAVEVGATGFEGLNRSMTGLLYAGTRCILWQPAGTPYALRSQIYVNVCVQGF